MRRIPRERGAALVMVVVVIGALLVIGAPFVISMRLHEKSSRTFAAQLKARQLADAGRNQAIVQLLSSHPHEERRVREAQGDLDSDPEGLDLHGEVQQVEARAEQGVELLEVGSPTTTMVHVESEDLRARLDLNTCGGTALANLLGVTVTAAPLSYREEERLFVEDTSAFYTDHDPETIDGALLVGRREFVWYRDIDRSRHIFLGLSRREWFSSSREPEDPEARRNFHPEGSIVQDARGGKIAADPLARYLGTEREGFLARFDSPAAVRRIADWEYGPLRAVWNLGNLAISLKTLRSLGFTDKSLRLAGLNPADFDFETPDRGEETSDQRERRLNAERQLEKWGLKLELVRRYGGDRAVLRTHDLLAKLDPERRERVLALYKQREEAVKQQVAQLDSWQKAEIKRQLKDLSLARDEAPYLETIGRIEFEDKLRPFLTVDAPPAGAGWSEPQVVNHSLHLLRSTGSRVRVLVEDTRAFQRGWMVRIRPLPDEEGRRRPPEYRYCTGKRNNAVFLFPQLDWDYDAREVEVSCRQPRPINVNTASREVLRAVLTGLQGRRGQRARAQGGQGPNVVTPREAAAVAEALVSNGSLETFPQLRELLIELRNDGAIDDHDYDAIYRNAVNPADSLLIHATVPFCFTSGDAYRIAATGIVNDDAGNELASHSYEEQVRVAPPRELTWHIDNQLAFSDRLYFSGPRPGNARDSANRLFLPGRRQNLMQSGPRHLGPYGATPFLYPTRSHAPGQGTLRPLLAREPDLDDGDTSTQSYAYGGLSPYDPQRHDGLFDGAPLSGERIPDGSLGQRFFMDPGGNGQPYLGPGLIRGWFRFDRLPGSGDRAYLFDGGRELEVDRLSLYLEGPDTLVLALKDEALDNAESSGQPRATEARFVRPGGFREQNWYHVAAYWRGSDRTDLAIAVDGQHGAVETHGSRLSASIGRWDTRIPLDDVSEFPPQGWVRIGGTRWRDGPQGERGVWGRPTEANQYCEVLHYSSIDGNSLVVDEVDVLLEGDFNEPATVRALYEDLSGELLSVRDVELGEDLTPSSVPLTARTPLRGSGHRHRLQYRYTQTLTLPNGSTRTREINATARVRLGYPHEAGTVVVPFGYLSRVVNGGSGAFQDVVRRGERSLQDALPENTPATLLYSPPGGQYDGTNPLPIVLQPTENQIPLIWADFYPDAPSGPAFPIPTDGSDPVRKRTGGFPQRGVVRISSFTTDPNATQRITVERVYYRNIRRDQTTGICYLENCIRGVEGTTPQAHALFATVVLESLKLDGDPSDYPSRADGSEPRVYVSLNRPDPNAIQPPRDHVEWLSVETVNDPQLIHENFILLPARDSVNSDAVGYVPPPSDIVSVLISWLVERQGNLIPGPGNQFVFPPVQPITAQPWPTNSLYPNQPVKELLKLWEPSQARLLDFLVDTILRLARLAGLSTIEIPDIPRSLRRAAYPFEVGARGTKGTSAPENGWPAGTEVIPTFAVREADGLFPQNEEDFQYRGIYTQSEVGADDILTLVDENQDEDLRREERRVVHSALSRRTLIPQMQTWLDAAQAMAPIMGITVPTIPEFGDRADGWLVAFDSFVDREYRAEHDARLARWPVGNLSSVPPELHLGQRMPDPDDPGAGSTDVLEGVYDDLVSEQLREEVTVALGVLDATTDTVNDAIDVQNNWSSGRLLRTDGEVVAVTDAAPSGGGHALTLLRGALGSTRATISPETAAWNLTWPAFAIAEGGFGAQGRRIPIRNPDPGPRRFREGLDGGYLAIDRGNGNAYASVVPYRSQGRNQGFFERPLDRFQRGIYDSAFGSDRANPNTGDLLVDLPFRHHDRYEPLSDSLQGVYFQTGRELPGSYILRVEWDEQLPSPFCDVRVALRCDGDPSWGAQPAQGPGEYGSIYLFDDPEEPNEVMLRADRVELRVYITFKEQAFFQDAWKDAAVVGAVRVVYRQPTQTIRREERTQ